LSLFDKIKGVFGRPRTKPIAGYPRVTTRVSQDDEFVKSSHNLGVFDHIPAVFPFQYYALIDNLSLIDPYVSKYIHTTVSLGNPGHKIYITADNEARADEALEVANALSARCFPFAGGMDGVANSVLNQLARAGGSCFEWVPDRGFTRIERAFCVPIKSLRFRYKDDKGNIELGQISGVDWKPLNMIQTVYYGLVLRETSPYPVPPLIAALESCAEHRKIFGQIKSWMDKVSALGVLLAEVQPPPREPGETQNAYDVKCQSYLDNIAETVNDNLNSGLGVAYSNIKFTFQNTQAGAQGAKDILQLVLQGLFAALQRDPVFFGWNFNTTETFAKIVYEEMVQSLRTFQMGLRKVLEHGHRLNLALHGMGDIGVTIGLKENASVDEFKDSQSAYVRAQAILAQMEAGVITPEEARKLLGHEEKNIEAGAYVASFSRETGRYHKERHATRIWNINFVPTRGVDVDEVTRIKTQDGRLRALSLRD